MIELKYEIAFDFIKKIQFKIRNFNLIVIFLSQISLEKNKNADSYSADFDFEFIFRK